MLNAGSSEEVSDFGILSDRPCVRQRMQASASLSAAVRLFPVFVIMQEALAAAAAQYHSTGEGDLYPPGAHAIGHGAEHGVGGEGAEGDASHMAKRTADWVQEGEEEQDEAKKARLDGEPGNADNDIQNMHS